MENRALGKGLSALIPDKTALGQNESVRVVKTIAIKEILVKTGIQNLDIAPCNINLTGAEIELVGALSRETRLRRALDSVKNEYDFIFIDTPPSLGLLTLNALAACDSTIIPIQCEFYALEGVSQFLKTVNLIRDGLNANLEIEGVLLTMAECRTNLTNEVISEIKGYFKDKVYKTTIPRNIKLSEAPSFGKPIAIYDRTSIGAKRYEEFAREFLGETVASRDAQENQNCASPSDPSASQKAANITLNE